jgi:phosphoserine phosphatase
MYKNRINLALVGVLFLFLSVFNISSAKRKKTQKCKIDNYETILEYIKSGNYKYAIFDATCTCFPPSVNDLLDAYYEKNKHNLSWIKRISISATMVKLGALWLVGSLDPKRAYEDFLSFFKGKTKKEFQKECCEIYKEKCKHSVFVAAKKIFDACKVKKVITIIAEVGMDFFYEDFKKDYGFDYLCATELEVKDGKITGKLAGDPCTGKWKLEKVKNLIEKKLEGSLKDTIFFANSHNDVYLLNEVKRL